LFVVSLIIVIAMQKIPFIRKIVPWFCASST
jgi:hypothetical protein